MTILDIIDAFNYVEKKHKGTILTPSKNFKSGFPFSVIVRTPSGKEYQKFFVNTEYELNRDKLIHSLEEWI